MTLPEYITATRSTDLVNTVKHAALGLISEVGEVYGVLAKIERGDPLNRAERMTGELGDVAWYLARLTDLQQFPGDRPFLQVATDINGYDYHSNLSDIAKYGNRQLSLGCGISAQFRFTSLCHAWGCWHSLCSIENLDPAAVLTANLAKLRDRQARRVLQGDGDHR